MNRVRIGNLVEQKILSAKKNYAKMDRIKYIDISSIDKTRNKLKGYTEYIFEEAPSRAQQCLLKNDVLVSTVRPNLRNIAINDYENDNYVGSSGFCVLRANDKCDSHYLYYSLLTNDFTNSMVSLTAGAAYPAIKDSDILNYEINVPSLPEQQKIAAHLDTIQSAIDNKKQQLQQLDELVKSKFVEMFGENPVESGNWKVEKLNEITDVRDGTHDSPSYYSEGYPFITTKNLIDGKIDFSTASLICKEDYDHFDKRSHVDDGDILMPMIGTIGGAVLVKKDRDFAIKNVSLIKRRSDNLNFKYLLSVLNSDFMNEYFEQFKIGGTQKFISLSFIRLLPIPVPPIELQNTFAEYVQKIDSAKSIIKTQLNDLNELLESKMDFFFGE